MIGGNCPRRKVDAQTIKNYFLANGMFSVDDIRRADVIIVITCGGFNTSEDASIRTLTYAVNNAKPAALIIATGCLAKINPTPINELGLRVIAWECLREMDDVINAKVKFDEIPSATELDDFPPLIGIPFWRSVFMQLQWHKAFFNSALIYLRKKKTRFGRQRLFEKEFFNIMIARGCLGNCSYCSIRFAHGKLKSQRPEIVVSKFKEGMSKGFKKFVLIAEDTGSYGIDLKTNIVELFKRLFSVQGDYKIIINDFNPQWMVRYFDELLPLLVKNKDRIVDIRMPIESASNSVLKLMRRPYVIEDVEFCVKRLIEEGFTVRTHFIVGFPGETMDDLMKTYNFISKYSLKGVLIYEYEERQICDSAKLPKKVSEPEIRRRAKILRQIVYT